MLAPATSRTTTLAELVQALLGTWKQGCDLTTSSQEDMRRHAARDNEPLVFMAPDAGGQPQPAPLVMTVRELLAPRSFRPTELRFSFDCLLQPSRGGAWSIRILPRRRWPLSIITRDRHRVDIVITGQEFPKALIRFDGHVLQRAALAASES